MAATDQIPGQEYEYVDNPASISQRAPWTDRSPARGILF